jgi:hypothetical protein
MSAPFMRPRTVPEILGASFQILRQHYGPIVAATGLILLPSILLAALLPAGSGQLVELVQSILITYAAAATVLMVADVALGREPDMWGALRQVRGRAWLILGAAILQGLAIMFGMLLLVIPGIIAMALLFAVPIVVMVEGKENVSDVMSRSASLAQGDMLRVLGATVLAFLIVIAAQMGLRLLVVFTAEVALDFLPLATDIEERQADLLTRTLSIFVFPFPSVVATLLYFDLRVRKEGFGMDDLSASLPPSGHELARPAL